jgi:hypothetical protein
LVRLQLHLLRFPVLRRDLAMLKIGTNVSAAYLAFDSLSCLKILLTYLAITSIYLTVASSLPVFQKRHLFKKMVLTDTNEV